MNRNIEKLEELPYFTVRNVARTMEITRPSARVLCSRYVRDGYFLRLKNDFYLTARCAKTMTRQEWFTVANYLQVPSYISFITALEYCEATTQVTREVFECAALKRTAVYEMETASFRFYKLNKKYYSGFERKNGVFMAGPEKALLDAVYLFSFGKYRLDWSALDSGKFNHNELDRISREYPIKTRSALEKICRTW